MNPYCQTSHIAMQSKNTRRNRGAQVRTHGGAQSCSVRVIAERTRVLALIALLPLLFLAILAALPARASDHLADAYPFRAFAGEILDGLAATDFARLPATSGYGAPRIAIRPFGEGDTPLSPVVANGYNRRLLAELQRQAGNRFRFVALESLATLIRDIKASGLPQSEIEARIADLRASARADVLIIGSMRLEQSSAVLSYQAVDTESGGLFASTPPRQVPGETRFAESLPVREPIQTRPAFVRSPAFGGPGAQRPPMDGLPQRHRVIMETERRLYDLGYDPGPVDGYLTRETREALMAYQADSALPVNGRMTRRVVKNLRRDTR